jgi:hypothetical protein
MVLRPLLTSAASAWSHNQAYRSRLDGRSPQVRTLTFPAHLPYLLLWPLVALRFVVSCQLARPLSLIRFVCLRSQVCFRLPPDPASRRRPCLPLTVGATYLRMGLSPSSQRPCWAHKITAHQLGAPSNEVWARYVPPAPNHSTNANTPTQCYTIFSAPHLRSALGHCQATCCRQVLADRIY